MAKTKEGKEEHPQTATPPLRNVRMVISLKGLPPDIVKKREMLTIEVGFVILFTTVAQFTA